MGCAVCVPGMILGKGGQISGKGFDCTVGSALKGDLFVKSLANIFLGQAEGTGRKGPPRFSAMGAESFAANSLAGFAVECLFQEEWIDLARTIRQRNLPYLL